MLAVFVRPNHPNYGTGEWRYHGYVVALVRCIDWKQALEVKALLMNEGLPEPYEGHASYEQGWYGGRMDLVALLDGDNVSSASHMVYAPVERFRAKASIGDNRYAGYYTAEELLSGG